MKEPKRTHAHAHTHTLTVPLEIFYNSVEKAHCALEDTRRLKMYQLRKQPILLAILFLAVVLLVINCSRKKEVEKKQIILISIDTLRGDHITPYGYVRDTSPRVGCIR